MTSDACLDENQLQAVLEGRMPQHDPARAHLADCASCRAILAMAREASMSALQAAVSDGLLVAPVVRGQTIGRFLILDRLGEGAMGAVYAAYDADLDRRIAVKVLRHPGEVGGRLRQQLRTEAQAMARLTHPNVIRVYDVGDHEGAPFIAMELVEGATLGEWLAERPRTWREIAARFAEAAAGLAAAHDAGVVHRDFKPSNVLVRKDGQTFVTDFGLAVTEPSRREIAGTPRYMAPEVVFGEGATARSDVFSFGVALHEALYGRVEPTALEDLRESLLAPEDDDEVPAWLRAEIALALHPDPHERRSMHALVETLARAADEDTAERCARAGAPADAVWNEGVAARVEAAFLATGVPSAAHAFAGVARAFADWRERWARLARELCVDTEVRSQPEALLARRAAFLHRRRLEAQALAEVLATADAPLVLRALDAVESLGALGSVGDLSTDTPMPTEAQRAAVEEVHRDLARVVALREAGRYDEPRVLAEEALARALAIRYRPLVAECRFEIGILTDRLGRLDTAQDRLYEAACEALAVHDDALAAKALLGVAPVLGNKRSDFAGAHRALDLAQALVERIGGDLDLTATLDHCRAQVAYKQGLLDEAIALYRRALDARRRVRDARWSSERRIDEIIRNNLANALARKGDTEAALAEHEALLAARIARHGPIHPLVGSSYNNLGFALMQVDRAEEALEAFEKALATDTSALPEGHDAIGLTTANVGFALAALGQLDTAIERLEQGRDLLRRSKGPQAVDVIEVESEIANVQVRRGALDAAANALDRAFAALDLSTGRDHPTAATAHAADGALRLARGDAADAAEAFARAVGLAEKSRPTALAAPLVGLARARLSLGDRPGAIEALERVQGLGGRVGPRVAAEVASLLEGARREP